MTVKIPAWLADFFENAIESERIEVKTWIDLRNKEHLSIFVRALLAIANTGGGHLLIGVDDIAGKLKPAQPPQDEVRNSWVHDTVIGKLHGLVEPPLDVNVSLFAAPDRGWDVVVVDVPSCGPSPVFATKEFKEATKSTRPRKHGIYIRCQRGGGWSSAEPASTKEWRDLIRRLLVADRDALLGDIRSVVVGSVPSDVAEPNIDRVFESWVTRMRKLWLSRLAAPGSLALKDLALGSIEYSYQLTDVQPTVTLPQLRDLCERAQLRGLSGWPLWPVLSDDAYRPQALNNGIEARIDDEFWRIELGLRAYAVRGYSEDELDEAAGCHLDPTQQIRRVIETLLHAERLGGARGATGIELHVHWTGLNGRKFHDARDWARWRVPQQTAQQSYTLRATFALPLDTATTPSELSSALAPFFETFSFFERTPQLTEKVWASVAQHRAG